MNLSELRTKSSAEIDVLATFIGSLSGDPLSFITSIGSFVDRAVGLIPRSSTFADTPPPGDPATIDGLAEQYENAALAAEAIQTTLSTVTGSSLPDALVGVTGASATQVLASVDTLVGTEIEGLRSGASGLRDYADAITSARTAHQPGADSIRDGHRTIGNISVNPWAMTNPITGAGEVAGVISDLIRGAGQILDGVSVCHEAYEDAWAAGEALQRALSDSEGYAVLAGVEVPVGQTRLDVLVSRTQFPNGDPDGSVLSETEWANYVQNWNAMSDDERERILAAMEESGDPAVSALLMSAIATGAGSSSVLALADAIKNAPPGERQRMIDELTNLGVGDNGDATVNGETFDQYNNKTCGSTTLITLAAQSDPFLAYWLQTGEFLDGHVPDYLRGLDLADAAGLDTEDRMTFLQQAVQDRANDLFPGPIDYPNVAGTAPGGAVAESDRTGTDYHIDWTNALGGDSGRGAALTEAAAAANDGTPVPLLVGPSDNTIPQHYVLIIGFHDGDYEIYDPSTGETNSVEEDIMLNGSDEPVTGFANWNQIYAVVNPS